MSISAPTFDPALSADGLRFALCATRWNLEIVEQLLSGARAALEKRGEPGLFRVMQMQRCLWAETEGGKLRLHGSHASSPENLAQIVEIFEREGGRRPVEKARQERAAAKVRRAKK